MLIWQFRGDDARKSKADAVDLRRHILRPCHSCFVQLAW